MPRMTCKGLLAKLADRDATIDALRLQLSEAHEARVELLASIERETNFKVSAQDRCSEAEERVAELEKEVSDDNEIISKLETEVEQKVDRARLLRLALEVQALLTCDDPSLRRIDSRAVLAQCRAAIGELSDSFPHNWAERNDRPTTVEAA